ncbi:MAG: DUF3299 domain-containing protein [Balneolaceae bacterium]
MLKKITLFPLFLIIFTIFSGFTLNTENETLSDDSEVITIKWEVLANVEWKWDGDFYEAVFSEEAKKLDGKEVIVEGFMFPLEYTRKHKTFLISSSPMSNCFFCGPGEAESMVYVLADEPMDYKTTPFKMKGTFKLVDDVSMGILYQLDNAKPVN